MKPMLVDYLQASDGSVTRLDPQPWTQVCDPSVSATIASAMVQAVEGKYGKLFAGGAAIPGVTTAARAALPSWPATPRRTAGSSATRRPRRRRSPLP